MKPGQELKLFLGQLPSEKENTSHASEKSDINQFSPCLHHINKCANCLLRISVHMQSPRKNNRTSILKFASTQYVLIEERTLKPEGVENLTVMRGRRRSKGTWKGNALA